MHKHSDHLLSQWAKFTHRHTGGLGYRHTTLEWLGSRLPRGVNLPGIHAYNRVEATLSDLGDKHRVADSLEYGVLRPNGEP